jgi:hypothetical protein
VVRARAEGKKGFFFLPQIDPLPENLWQQADDIVALIEHFNDESEDEDV